VEKLSRRRLLIAGGTLVSVALVACQQLEPVAPSPPPATPAPPIPTPVPPPAPAPATSSPATPTPEPVAAVPTVAIVPSATATPTPVPRAVTWWTGPSDPAWLAATEAVRASAVRLQPTVTLTVSGGHVDYGRVVGGVASGQSPDLLDVGSLAPYAARGIIRDLNQYLDKNGTLTANYLPAMWANGSWAGDTYGVPALDHGPELGLLWNQTLVGDRLTQSTLPSGWDELLALGRSLSQMDAKGAIDVLAFDPLDGVGGLLDTVRDVTGVDWYDAGARRADLANASYARFLQGIVDYYQSFKPAAVADFRQGVAPMTETADSGLANGKELALITGYWSPGDLSKVQRDAAWRFGAGWLPTQRSDAHVQRVGGRLATIPAAAAHPDDAWQIINLLVSDEVNLAFWQRAGRFATTRSLARLDAVRRDPALAFYLDSVEHANVVSSREGGPVAGYAQTKWEQAIQDVLGGGKTVAAALAAAQSATAGEIARLTS
jgi:ABC-type glycerol-3-phosphate transport system substrate-binding protein